MKLEELEELDIHPLHQKYGDKLHMFKHKTWVLLFELLSNDNYEPYHLHKAKLEEIINKSFKL